MDTPDLQQVTNLARAASTHNAVEDPDTGEYIASYDQLLGICADLGARVPMMPTTWESREFRLRRAKDSILAVRVDRQKDEPTPNGWVSKRDKTGRIFTRSLHVAVETDNEDFFTMLQQHVRAAVIQTSEGNKLEGWYIMCADGEWMEVGNYMAESRLQELLNKQGRDTRPLMGALARRRFTLTNIPFAGEYPPSNIPGQKLWNRGAIQLRHKPAPGNHPTWDKLFEHVFRDIDGPVATNQWCRANGIKSGADYGRLWVASVINNSFQHLPYLFLWGSENSGKSTFHEALALLLTHGVVLADRALTNQNDFNGDLRDCVFAVVEEKNVALPQARARMKEWVTGLNISIRKMRTDSYMQRNTLHWIQCANDLSYCPVWPGDTRIVSIHVGQPEDIPKKLFMRQLKEEAAAFTHTLVNLAIPEPAGRLLLPVLATNSKATAINMVSPINEWVVECCELRSDAKISKADLYADYKRWKADQPDNDIPTQAKFGRELLKAYPSISAEAKIKVDGEWVKAYEGIGLRLKITREAG